MDTNPNPVVNPVPTTPNPVEPGKPIEGQGLPAAPIVTPNPEPSAPGAPGSKTPPELLLKSLQEERQKVKELQDLLAEKSFASGEAISDEGKLLEKKINDLGQQITDLTSGNLKRELQDSNPIFKEKWDEFETFRQLPENTGMPLKTAAKAFLIEKGQMDPTRPGLENPTGGPRVPVTPTMTAEDVKSIRENVPRKYREMVEKGQIKI